MSITSSEVNYLVYRYLTESGKSSLNKIVLIIFNFFIGYNHTAFTFFHESEVDKTIPTIHHSDVPLGMLVSILQKGLQYNMIETHIQPDGTYKPCRAPFSLLTPHRCIDAPPSLTSSSSSSSSAAAPSATSSSNAGAFTLTSPPPTSGAASSPRTLPQQQPSPVTLSSQPSSPATSAASSSALSPKMSRSKLSISTIVEQQPAPRNSSSSNEMEVEEAPAHSYCDLTKGTLEPQGRDSFRAVSAGSIRVGTTRLAPAGCGLLCVLPATDSSSSSGANSSCAYLYHPSRAEERVLAPSAATNTTATAAAWRCDGKALCVGYSDGTCRVWDPEGSCRLVKELRGCHQGRVGGLRWSPRGTRLCTLGSDDASLCLWDTTTWALLAKHSPPQSQSQSQQQQQQRERITGFAWRSESAFAFVAGLKVYCYSDVAQTAPSSVLTPHTKRITSLAWDTTATSSPSLLASASDDCTVCISTVHDRQQQQETASRPLSLSLPQSSQVLDVQWVPRGSNSSGGSSLPRRLAALTREGVAVWEAPWQPAKAPAAEWRCVDAREMAWSNSGRFVAVAEGNGGVRVWAAESGTVVRVFRNEGCVCRDLRWAEKDDLLAVSCADRSCILDLKK